MSEIVDCIAWIVQKTCYSFYVFLEFILLRLLDLLGLIFNIAACLTIVRFPPMFLQLANLEDLEEWRYVGLVQLLIFISDIPVMIAGIFLLLTVYRMFPVIRELKEENCKWDVSTKGGIYYSGWKPRKIILKHFSLLVIDALFIPAALLCLCSWRCVIFIREFKKTDDSWERRKICFKQLINIFIDIPCIILYLVCIFTWRLPFVIHDWLELRDDNWEKWDWDDVRFYSIYHFGLLLLDIPCIACFFLSIVTWRCPFVFRKLRKIRLFKEEGEMKARKLVIVQFLLIFVDIPCIVFFIVVVLTIWRLPFFIHDCKRAFKKNKNRQWRIRQACIVQFILLFVDMGCLLLAIIVLATFWRIYPLIKAVKKIFEPKKEEPKNHGEDGSLEDDRDQDSGREQPESSDACEENVVVELRIDREEESSASHQSESSLNSKKGWDEGDTVPVDEKERTSRDGLDNEDPAPTVGIKPGIQIIFDRKVGWKIRKAICIQFVSLLVDIPAFALLVLLLATVIRVPKLLSAFLQSSDIYLEFAITVYFQTFILLVDLLFVLLFLLLMILRPIESWVRLLEDEDHMKYRLLRHHMQWVPDIVVKRKDVYQQIDELLSVDLKMLRMPTLFHSAVETIMLDYLDELRCVRNTLRDGELDPEYIHLLDTVLFWEEKRKEKALRRYLCEYNYLLRPDAGLHKENIEKIKREMVMYEGNVDEHYARLSQFVPVRVPLWTTSTGLSTRTRKETQKVLIECLPRGDIFLMLLALLCCLPLYRAPQLIRSLWKYWYNRANIVLHTTREIGHDFLTLLRILIVLVFLYRAPFLLSDISIDIFDKKSWKAVRETVRKYPMYIWEDLINIVKTLFSWKTPRFLFTATLFGILMPADMFLTSSKLCVKNINVAYLMSGVLYIIFIGFPFLMSLYLGNMVLEVGIGWVSVPIVCSFVAALLLVLALMVTAYVKSSKETTLVPQPFDYFHWNWFNIHVIVMELLEFFQLLALVFIYSDIPMYGGDLLNKASKFLLSSHFSFKFQFWLAFGLFFVWFFLSSVPVIFEQILDDLPKGTCEKHTGWRMAISLFANTLFITMVEGFSSCIGCSYAKCPAGVKYTMLPSNSTCFKAYLTDDTTYACWTGEHRLISLFGLFALVWYTTTSFLVTVQFGDPGIKKQDVEFSPTYNVISNFIKSIMIVCAVVITTNRYAMLGVLVAGNMFLVIYTVLFKAFFHYKPTNSLSFMTWRVGSYCAATIAAIAVIIAYKINEPQSNVPLIIFSVGTLLSLIVAGIVSAVLRQRGNVIEARDKFKTRLISLESRLLKDNLLLGSWKMQQKAWKHLVRRVRESRRDDQIYDEADWARLKGKETEGRIAEGKDEMDQAVVQENVTTDTECANADEISVDPLPSPMLPPGLPPPPSYGSTNTETVDGKAAAVSVFPMFTADQEKIETAPFDQPLTTLERNGVNLLLVLEKSIRFEAYSYSFFSQRGIWLSSVSLSNWTGLLHCVDVLESNLDFSFNQPSAFDVSLGAKSLDSDVLEQDPRDNDEPPSYTPEARDPDVISANSQSQRDQALIDVARVPQHGEHWKALMDKVLPDIPVIKLWKYDDFSGDFEIILRRPATATITEVGPKGVKLAKGATLSLGKRTIGNLGKSRIAFSSGFEPKGSKGPISVTVADIAFKWKKKTWYLESQGKGVKYDVAIESMHGLQWR